MSISAKLGLWASSAALAVLATTFGANAHCSMTGTWHFNGVHGTTATSCTINVNNLGIVTSLTNKCHAYPLNATAISFTLSPPTGNSTLSVDSTCKLTGEFYSDRLSYPVRIFGYLNGNYASAIGIPWDDNLGTRVNTYPVRLDDFMKIK